MESDDSDSDHSDELSYEDSVKNDDNETSSQRYICDSCSKPYRSRTSAIKHINSCVKRSQLTLRCSWCNLDFVNRGNLANHALRVHGDQSYKLANQKKIWYRRFKCDVCSQEFPEMHKLRYHIRRQHFNLQGNIPYAEFKKVNQVWFEKVRNTNKILEIKKTGPNTLVMRKLDDNTAIKVHDVPTETIDLRDMYPVNYRTNIKIVYVNCKVCNQRMIKRDYKKHLEEVHLDLRKYSCNNCNRTFKRAYIYLQHVCSKTGVKVRGVKYARDNTFRIASIQSLPLPP